jgi:hypothetical protein
LVDLPDELILLIMNKVKPEVLLLCSIITVGNNRLEQLALDKCHSIDLTFDYCQSPYKSLIRRFYSHVMPSIIHNVGDIVIPIICSFHCDLLSSFLLLSFSLFGPHTVRA